MPKYDVIYPHAKAGETGTSGGAVIARFFDRGICACGSATHWHRYPDDVHPVPTCSTECEAAADERRLAKEKR